MVLNKLTMNLRSCVFFQPARFTANGERLKDTALVIRVFGYLTHTQLDIDSFLNFLNLVDLKVGEFNVVFISISILAEFPLSRIYSIKCNQE